MCNQECLDTVLGSFPQDCVQSFTLKQFAFGLYGGPNRLRFFKAVFLLTHRIVYLLLMVPHKYLPNVSKLSAQDPGSLPLGTQPFKVSLSAGLCAISWEHFNNRQS